MHQLLKYFFWIFIFALPSCNKSQQYYFSVHERSNLVSKPGKPVLETSDSLQDILTAGIERETHLQGTEVRSLGLPTVSRSGIYERSVVSGEVESPLLRTQKTAGLVNPTYQPKNKSIRKNIKREALGSLALVILAIIIPFLAVYFVDGITKPFWITILLSFLLWLPGVIYAIYRILRTED